jgi:hypothetical protein
MTKTRLISYSTWHSTRFCSLTIEERYIYLSLVANADDYGVLNPNPNFLFAVVFPYSDNYSFTMSNFNKTLQDFEDKKILEKFRANDREWYYIPRFLEEQNTQYRTQSSNPRPPGFDAFQKLLLLKKSKKKSGRGKTKKSEG